MDEATLRQLGEMRLFGGIRWQDLPHLLACIGGVERSCARGSFIFLEGEALRQVGVIISGTVQMVKEDVWGSRMILTSFAPGDVFGESFVCNDQAASTVSFLATADCRILFLPFHRLLAACARSCQFHHRLIENMAVILAAKNVQLMNKMELLAKKTIRERILLWLSQQAQYQGSTRITSPLGRVELAEYLCVDRSALTRELNRMKADGLIDFKRNAFELRVPQ